nr:MAG TPA: hypothetical protein [Caudoviricetes sp.]
MPSSSLNCLILFIITSYIIITISYKEKNKFSKMEKYLKKTIDFPSGKV